ncbi:MAG: EAL domain-containing protein [Pseudolabrys sp.]|nr:EAL domain-containing protein [Pseudolabrys sp.]MDP2294935.1 EAL domain-containing protein [Pseudolabrys sp.]
MPAVARRSTSEQQQYNNWDRARLSVVVPIGVIVAVAIVCIVVAVLSSAQRADEVAIDHEKQLFSGALTNYGRRVLSEVDSVASSQSATENIRRKFDPVWAEQRAGAWLAAYFKHDYILVFDGQDNPVYSMVGHHAADQAWYAQARPELIELLDFMRGRSTALPGAIQLDRLGQTELGVHAQAVAIRRVLGQPAAIAAVAVGSDEGLAASSDINAPIMLSVKFINDNVLASIASQLGLVNLRAIEPGPVPEGDFVYELNAPNGERVARFAWSAKRPGAEIVQSVVPFIAVALAGFALLAAFVLRYMRRTAVAIAAGETRLQHLAMHDPLCGLPNRIFFGERLEAVIGEVHASRTPAAVFYIDLDHFKDVNDTLGHPVGDELIRNVTLRLSHTLRGGDLVARLGGDEFAVISSIGGDTVKMMALAQRMITAICAPYNINGQNIVIGASIGIAVIDRDCAGSADIMRYADMALYRAKNEGRNRACIYDAAMDADLSKRKLLEGDLRDAIENDQLRLMYQPIVNKSGDTMMGVEALCRWTHPTRGEISPVEFIAIAEHSGLIVELGAWVLRQALVDGKQWPGLTVAVNVSPLQFRRADFAELVERTLTETEFDPARLELELTESVLLGNIDTAEAGMLRLKALGVRLALDDFGTGYSSLLYLRRFPFDKLKIDRSFVLSIEKAADAAAIVHAVVSLGRGLGMKVTAEGVETADQHLFLRAAGVHFMQGFRFGKATTPAEISARLKSPEDYRPIDIPSAMAG